MKVRMRGAILDRDGTIRVLEKVAFLPPGATPPPGARVVSDQAAQYDWRPIRSGERPGSADS